MAMPILTAHKDSLEYSPLLLPEYDQHQDHNEDKENDGLSDQNDDPCLQWQRLQSAHE